MYEEGRANVISVPTPEHHNPPLPQSVRPCADHVHVHRAGHTPHSGPLPQNGLTPYSSSLSLARLIPLRRLRYQLQKAETTYASQGETLSIEDSRVSYFGSMGNEHIVPDASNLSARLYSYIRNAYFTAPIPSRSIPHMHQLYAPSNASHHGEAASTTTTGNSIVFHKIMGMRHSGASKQ